MDSADDLLVPDRWVVHDDLSVDELSPAGPRVTSSDVLIRFKERGGHRTHAFQYEEGV